MTSTPIRIQRKRTRGWRMPDNTIYVGRLTAWGNPFVGENAVEFYRQMCLGTRKFYPPLPLFNLSDIEKLRGKNLACSCPLDQPCHADVLLELANR